MQNFNYKNPTEIIFGNGRIKEIGKLLSGRAKKVLLTYGKGSIKANGVYDEVTSSLKEYNIDFVEYSGIKPNPTLAHAQYGAEIAREEKVDGILAVGGGSVVDESKAIAIGACYKENLWDFYDGIAKPEKSIPLYVIMTVPATGSEMNPNGVITNESTKIKKGFRTPLNFPVFSILDPEVTLSVPIEYTNLAAVDIMAHSIEAYFSKKDNDSYVLDRYVEGIGKTVLESVEKLNKNPKDLGARENIMWASTLAWNGLVHCGVGEWINVNHVIEMPLSSVYDMAHAAGLAIIIPASMKYFKEKYKNRLEKYGKNVFGITGENIAEKTINAFENWYKSLNIPTTFKDAGIEKPDIKLLAELAMKPIGNSEFLNKNDVIKILELAK